MNSGLIKKDEIKIVLITRTDNLGDMILTLPLINEARRIFPEAKILFMVKKYNSELLREYQGIDEIIFIEDFKGINDKIRLFKNRKIDLVINAKPEFDLALSFFLSGIRYRIGTSYRWYSFLYNCKVHEHRKYSIKHESEYNINLLKTFFNEAGYGSRIKLKFSFEEKNLLNEKLHGLLERKYIVIHPGSRGSAKDLPAEKLLEFADKFLSVFKDTEIILTGIDSEKESVKILFDGLNGKYKDKITDLTGRLGLRELMILIDNAEIFVSNSTGPIHIAGALNKNIIGFYPNEKVMSEMRWKPLSVNAVILKPPVGCDDMSMIDAEAIYHSAETFLKM